VRDSFDKIFISRRPETNRGGEEKRSITSHNTAVSECTRVATDGFTCEYNRAFHGRGNERERFRVASSEANKLDSEEESSGRSATTTLDPRPIMDGDGRANVVDERRVRRLCIIRRSASSRVEAEEETVPRGAFLRGSTAPRNPR